MKDETVQRNGPRARAEFLIDLLALGRPMQIADVGARLANSGAPYDMLMKLGAAHVSGFEPDPEAFKAMQAAMPANATCYPDAVGKPGKATFYSHAIGTLSSIFKFHAPAARYLGKGFWVKRPITEVPITLVALDKIKDFPTLDLIKMDVQGAELDILKGAQNVLADAMVIIPEVRFYRMYQDEPMWADVDTYLRGMGFVLHKFIAPKSVALPSSQKSRFTNKAAYSQLLDGDAVYIRNLEEPETLSVDQIKCLALAADSVFHSHDLVAFCLDQLAERGAVPKGSAKKYVDRLPPEIAGPPMSKEDRKKAKATAE